MLDLVEGILSNIPHNVVGHAVITHIHNPLCKSGNQNNHHTLYRDLKYPIKIHKPLFNDQINGLTRQNREVQRQRHCNGGQHNGKYQKRNISFHIMEHLFQGADLFFSILLLTHAAPPCPLS